MELIEKIESLRNQLNHIIKSQRIFSTEEIIELSEKLDILINEYYKIKSEADLHTESQYNQKHT